VVRDDQIVVRDDQIVVRDEKIVAHQIGRETLDPGRWPRERLFHGVPDSHVVGAESVADAAKNLSLGWLLFPMRVIPQVQFYASAVAVGVVATVFALIFTEICGRLITGKHWKI